jgi:aubergine-like protein
VVQIKSAFKRINENYHPQFAMIMINKKINQRFFASAPGGGRYKDKPLVNPPSGTIIADKVFE